MATEKTKVSEKPLMTSDEAGIDKNLAIRVRKLHALSPDDFETLLAEGREDGTRNIAPDLPSDSRERRAPDSPLTATGCRARGDLLPLGAAVIAEMRMPPGQGQTSYGRRRGSGGLRPRWVRLSDAGRSCRFGLAVQRAASPKDPRGRAQCFIGLGK